MQRGTATDVSRVPHRLIELVHVDAQPQPGRWQMLPRLKAQRPVLGEESATPVVRRTVSFVTLRRSGPERMFPGRSEQL
jgi:hypothetical protein